MNGKIKKIISLLSYSLFFGGIFAGTFGQFIWALIFWNNNEMFMKHWNVAGVGLLMATVGVWKPVIDFVNKINKS